MAQCTKVSGKTISSTAEALKLGPINQDMMESMRLVASMASELISGMINRSTQETGAKIKSVVWAFMRGSMVEDMRENGLTTTWRAWESTLGTMAGSTKVSIKMIKSMALVSTPGQTHVVIKVTGTKVSSMVWEYTKFSKTTK
jgi:hypothetical protein